jgi:hypothetical protein
MGFSRIVIDACDERIQPPGRRAGLLGLVTAFSATPPRSSSTAAHARRHDEEGIHAELFGSDPRHIDALILPHAQLDDCVQVSA